MQTHFHDIGVYCIPIPHPFPVPPVNVILYKGEALTLFDAGTHTDAAHDALVDGLRTAGVSVRDLELIVLTHHHLDHIGLSRRLRDESGAEVWAHPHAVEQIAYMFDDTLARAHHERLLGELGVPEEIREKVIERRHAYKALLDSFVIDRTPEDNGPLGVFTAYFRPGHSATDVVYVHQEKRWAVTGDHLIANVTPNPILRRCPEKGTREKSLVQYRESLFKTRALKLAKCFPGHGPAFAEHRDAVDRTLRHIERRGRKVLGVVPETGATPYEVTRGLFPRLAEPELLYCLSAATGHLELLEEEGALCVNNHDGVLRYYRAPS